MVLFLNTGCVLFESQDTEQVFLPSERIFLHTVAFKGESLPLIAEWYTGSGKNWNKFKSYNGDVGRLYNLKAGSQIRIPEYLMIRKDPIEEDFVIAKHKAYLARAKKSSSAPKATPTNKPAVVEESESIEPSLSKNEEKLDAETQDELIENLLLSEFPPETPN